MPRVSSSLLPVAACLAALLTSACGKKHTSATTPRKTPSGAVASKASSKASSKSAGKAAVPAKPGTTQVGLASWYGEPYHGRRAANGEIYDMNKLTAAHRTLPFDTLVNVLNLDNQREVQVRINDRGPFVGDRIIDLSRAAAQQISMIGPGIAKVRIEVLGVSKEPPAAPARKPPISSPGSPPEPAPSSEPCPEPAPEEESAPATLTPEVPSAVTPPATSPAPQPMPSGETIISRTGYAVQIGAFKESKAAEKLQRKMASRYGGAYIENVRSDKGLLYRVRVGPKQTMAEAAQVAASLASENVSSLVVEVTLPVRN